MMWTWLAAGLVPAVLAGGAFVRADGDEPSPVLEVRPSHVVRVYGGGSLPEPALRAVLADAGWSGDSLDEAVDVAGCESSWDPRTTGDAGEAGLFQIHPIHFVRLDDLGASDPFDPLANAVLARILWLERGWEPWSCQPDA
jgi:hypothetical protein